MPSSGDIAKAYKDAQARVPARYKKGVERVVDFKERSIAGQSRYVEKMSMADVLARREKKTADMPDDEWKRKASTLGAERIARGMAANEEKRTRNYEPIRSALDGLSVPDKVVDVDANIDNILKPVVHTMRKAAGRE